MPNLIVIAAIAAAIASAAGLYAGSPHCRWATWRRCGRIGTWAGVLLALVALALWVVALGAGAGTCAMLGSWMLALMAFPYLAGMRVGHAVVEGER